MLASATDSITPSSRHLTDSSASTNSIRSSRSFSEIGRGIVGRREGVLQALPESGALAVLVFVEARAAQPAGPSRLEHVVDDGEGGVRRERAAFGLDGVLVGLADLADSFMLSSSESCSTGAG